MTKLFSHDFSQLTASDVETLKKYYKGYDYRGAGYTYLAHYIWRTTYCLQWEVIDGYLCMAGADCRGNGKDAVMSMPLTADGTYDPVKLRSVILECKRRFDEIGVPLVIVTIPAHMVDILREVFSEEELELERNRDYDEYVYLKEKLINLSGRALHKKKNHLNYFLRSFEYEAKPVTADMKQDIMALSEEIKKIKEMDPEEVDSLEHEYEAINEMIDAVDDPDVYSVAIFIKGKLQAFALGERLSEDTAIEHFEKANDEYRGLYQLVCREFCLSLPEEVIYINREEDMGLENLRQAKEALKPEYMEEKYFASFK